MIPKYAFRVEIYKKLGDKILRESKNYETLDGAYSYSSSAIRKPGVWRVSVMVVVDEWSGSGKKDDLVG